MGKSLSDIVRATALAGVIGAAGLVAGGCATPAPRIVPVVTTNGLGLGFDFSNRNEDKVDMSYAWGGTPPTDSNTNTNTLPLIYTCGGTREEMDNASIGQEKEIGKKIYYGGESINAVGRIGKKEGKLTNYLIYYGKNGIEEGKLVEKRPNDWCATVSWKADRLLEIFGEGRYVNKWQLNDVEIGEIEFIVLKKKK